MLSAYAIMAGLWAEEQLQGRLRIHPAVVVTSSEVLTGRARHAIQQAWGCQPFNQYVAAESCVPGLECNRHTGLHLFEDLVLFEVSTTIIRRSARACSGPRCW
jgi:phenylacetate-coenzyme A ligase PaaK-like adenylate-forming protein